MPRLVAANGKSKALVENYKTIKAAKKRNELKKLICPVNIEVAGIACYAGTTPEKAQETLDVIMAQFNQLSEGISEEEIQRAKVGLKSSLILSSESSGSRASGIGSDYYMLGRVRSLDEIKEKIERTSVDSVLGFLRNNKFEDFTVVTIGPKKVVVK